MDLIKRCPACNEENPVSEVICRVCMTNLASVSPSASAKLQGTQEDPASADEAGASECGDDADMTIEAPAMLTLSRVSDGRTLMARSGSLLGRSGETEEFFRDARTVSRSHARARFVDGTWRIEDLGSMNGTWVNGRRIKPGEPHPIESGDTVALSLACEMRVIE